MAKLTTISIYWVFISYIVNETEDVIFKYICVTFIKITSMSINTHRRINVWRGRDGEGKGEEEEDGERERNYYLSLFAPT